MPPISLRAPPIRDITGLVGLTECLIRSGALTATGVTHRTRSTPRPDKTGIPLTSTVCNRRLLAEHGRRCWRAEPSPGDASIGVRPADERGWAQVVNRAVMGAWSDPVMVFTTVGSSPRERSCGLLASPVPDWTLRMGSSRARETRMWSISSPRPRYSLHVATSQVPNVCGRQAESAPSGHEQAP